jgi:ATP-binding cassette subfamily B protein
LAYRAVLPGEAHKDQTTMTSSNTNEQADTAPAKDAEQVRSDFAVIADLLPYLRPYLGRILLALSLVLAAKLLNLLVPIVLKHIVDGLNVEPNLMMLPVCMLLAYAAARLG